MLLRRLASTGARLRAIGGLLVRLKRRRGGPMTAPNKYRRVLLKMGGEHLVGDDSPYGIDPRAAQRIARLLAQTIQDTEVELAIVIGGGNMWRGRDVVQYGMEPAQA